MDLQEFGATLRQEREAKGLSLDDAVTATKISRRNLAALEEGQGEELPHATYAKGFVRTYAVFLGMDPDKTVTSFMVAKGFGGEDEEIDLSKIRSHSERTAAINATLPSSGETDGLSERFGPWLRAGFGALVFIGALLAIGWGGREIFSRLPDDYKPVFLRGQPQGAGQPDAAPAPSVPPTPAHPPVSPPPAAQPQNGAPTAGTNHAAQSPAPAAPAIPDQPPPLPAPDKPGEPGRGAAGPVPPVPAPNPASGPAETVEAPKSERTLVISAREECWIRHSADGSGKMEKVTLKPGQTMTLKFQKSIRIRVGNAGGVALTLDGATLPPLGKSGEVVEKKLP